METSARVPERHAVVIGGSVAGLLAARVLADHAERVTLVERDRSLATGEPRAGVPQDRHLHVLLGGGQSALESLLPGVTRELEEQGSPRVGVPRDVLQWQGGGWLRRGANTTSYFTGHRPRLERLVRTRVLADPRIELLEGTEAVGLEGDASRVRGALLRRRGSSARRETTALAADLVVDASGRGSKAAAWMAALGAEPPHEEVIDTGLAYATRIYRHRSSDDIADCLGYYLVPDDTRPHGGVIMPIEDGRHLVTFSGLRDDRPPVGEDEFEEYAHRLPHPLLTEWLAGAEPLSPVYGFRNTANVRRRYDLPGRRPAGFLAVGDALCTFNPIYGQGMSVAAFCATALRDALAHPRRTPSTRRVQRALLAASAQAWTICAGADKAMPGATGNALGSTAADRLADWYLRRVQDRSKADPVVGAAFRGVLALDKPLTALFAPAVLRAALFDRVREGPAAPPLAPEDAARVAP